MPETSIYYQPELLMPDLLKRAVRSPHELFVGYVSQDGNLKYQTYRELLDEARLIAAGLSNLGLKQGDKVIIATLYNKETIELLWGCFFLGAVPTILQPPMTFSGYNPSVVKLVNVFKQLNEPYIFMSPEIKDSGELLKGKIKHKDDLDTKGNYTEPVLKPDDLAFIQFYPEVPVIQKGSCFLTAT